MDRRIILAISLTLVVILEYFLFEQWVKNTDPDPSVSLYIIILIPTIFLSNILIAGILHYFKLYYQRVFYTNSIIACFIMYDLFSHGIKEHVNRELDSWEFVYNDTTYQITQWKNSDLFGLSYQHNSGSSNVIFGEWEQRGDSIIINQINNEMYLVNNKLVNFRGNQKPISLTEVEY